MYFDVVIQNNFQWILYYTAGKNEKCLNFWGVRGKLTNKPIISGEVNFTSSMTQTSLTLETNI